MENKVQIFDNPEFGEVRVVMIDGKPHFVAADVCRILELGNITEALRRLDEDELTSVKLNSGGQMREMKLVNEPGLYRLIFASRKPEAKKFQRWVYHEVLPSIRKTGSYSTAPANNGIDLFAQAISELAAVEREKIALEREKMVFARDTFATVQLLREFTSALGENNLARKKLTQIAIDLLKTRNIIDRTDNLFEEPIPFPEN
ncbi:MAG: hypothetical protein IKP64_09480 [Selenomonadaceae bacterium]|nr:hypothetical protein [Selenomonadaceae bacterium]